jgi:hypothetical protein
MAHAKIIEDLRPTNTNHCALVERFKHFERPVDELVAG